MKTYLFATIVVTVVSQIAPMSISSNGNYTSIGLFTIPPALFGTQQNLIEFSIPYHRGFGIAPAIALLSIDKVEENHPENIVDFYIRVIQKLPTSIIAGV
jgi:hypothetical protein